MPLTKTPTLLEILEPIGISPKVFRTWCEQGLVTPVSGGNGPGSHRYFTLMQAVGIAVAAKEYAGERGCSPDYVGTVSAAFGHMHETELLKQFENRRTHLAAIQQGRPVLAGPRYPEWVNVEDAYGEVLAKVSSSERRLSAKRGRRVEGAAVS